jgi:uncharacterized protein (TIGR04255 family)
MTLYAQHDTLSNPPLAQVAFEVRFDSEATPESEQQLQDLLKEQYPIVEKINTEGFEISMTENGPIVKNINRESQRLDSITSQVSNSEKTSFCRLGHGVLNFVTSDYTGGFTVFFQNIDRILKNVWRVYSKDQKLLIRQIGLRYVNHINFSENPNLIFSDIKFHFQGNALTSNEFSQGSTLRLFYQSTHYFEDGNQNITIAYPQNFSISGNNVQNTSMILFDIDHFIQFSQKIEANYEDMLSWIQAAHNRIYQTFSSNVTDSFLERRK